VVKSTRLSLKWKRPKVIFTGSMNDPFHEQMPESFIWLNYSLAAADQCSMGLPAETGGPFFAPDRMSVWPVEGGRYGVDGTYQGATGFERAEAQRQRLEAAHLSASVRQELRNGWTLRLGPLTHGAAWAAIEAFLGSPGSRSG
jgi:hypothetical protein